MKFFPQILLSSVVVLNTTALFAMDPIKQVTGCRLQALSREQGTGNRVQVRDTNQVTEDRLQGTGPELAELLSDLSFQIGQRAGSTTNYELPTTNRNNRGGNLDCYLMMDPLTLGKGAEALEGALGVFGKKAPPSKPAITVTAVACSPVASGFSSAPSTMTSGQRLVEATPVSVDHETGEEHSTAQFLEKEICDNIYLSCLAKVAAMSFSERTSIEGSLNLSQEAREWAAAEQKAKRDVEKNQQALEAATEEKKIVDKEIKMMWDDRTFHGGAVVNKAYRDFKIKELGEQLAKARVETAKATLYAIQVKNTEQSAAAKQDLNEAIAAEKKALQALEEAQSHAVEQSFFNVSIPIAEAVAVEAFAVHSDSYSYEAYPHNQQFNSLNLSPERTAQEEQKASAKKEKAAAAFEKEFAMMIENSKLQAEEAAEAAEAAQEKAEKQSPSEKAWNKVIEEAEIAEEAYTHLVGLYEMYKEQAAEHYEGGMLKTKGSKYNFELKKAEKKKTHWTTEVEECREKKEALKHGAVEKLLVQEQASEQQVAAEYEALLAQQAKEHEEFIAQEKMRQIKLEAEAAIVREREALEMEKKKKAEDETNQLAKQKELEKEKENLAREQALAQQEAATKNQEKMRLEVKAAEVAVQAKTLAKAPVDSVNLSAECATESTDDQSNFNDASNSKSLLSSSISDLPSLTAAVASLTSRRPPRPIVPLESDRKLIETWETMETEIEENSERAKLAGNTDEDYQWTSAFNQLSGTVRKLKEAIKAENAGKPEEARKLREVVDDSRYSSELFIQSARAYGQEKKDEGENWGQAGSNLANAVIELEEAIVSESVGKSEEALKFRKAFEQKKRQAELFTKAARAYEQGKTAEGKSWNDAANALNCAVFALENAIQAEAKGKTAEAQTLREEAAKDLKEAEEFQREAEAAAQANILAEESKATTAVETPVNLVNQSGECASGSTNDQNSSNRLFSKFACADEVQGVDSASGSLWQELLDASSTGATQRFTAEVEFGKKSNDDCSSKPLLPSLISDLPSLTAAVASLTSRRPPRPIVPLESDRKLIETWETMETEIEENSERAKLAGNTDEDYQWTLASNQLSGTVRKLKEAIKAENVGKPEEARKLREVVDDSRYSSELYTEAAKAYRQGKKDEGKSWSGAGDGFMCAVGRLEKAIKAESAGKLEDSLKWCEAAEQKKYSGELYIQSARAYEQEKTVEGKSWNDAANALNSAAFALEDAIQAEAKGKTAEAQTLREDAAKYQQEAEKHQRAAEAAAKVKTLAEDGKATLAVEAPVDLGDLSIEYATGSTNHQSDSNDVCSSKPLLPSPIAAAVSQSTAYNLQPIASIRPTGIIGTIEGDQKLIETWETMMKEMKEKEKRANAAGKTDEGGEWGDVWCQLNNAVYKLKEAIKAEREGKPKEAQKWREVVECSRRSAELHTQSAIAYNGGKTEEGKSWSDAGHNFSYVADNLEKVIKAESAGKSEEAQKWCEAAEQYKHAGELYIQSARVYGQGKEDEGKSWEEAGFIFRIAITEFEKAIVAESAGRSEEAEKFYKAAEQLKRVAELFIKSARAYGQGKIAEGKSWNSAAEALRTAAMKLEQTTAAEAKGKAAEAQNLRAEAEEWQQEAEAHQREAEQLSGQQDATKG